MIKVKLSAWIKFNKLMEIYSKQILLYYNAVFQLPTLLTNFLQLYFSDFQRKSSCQQLTESHVLTW